MIPRVKHLCVASGAGGDVVDVLRDKVVKELVVERAVDVAVGGGTQTVMVSITVSMFVTVTTWVVQLDTITVTVEPLAEDDDGAWVIEEDRFEICVT
ncbi:hypothetical protein ColKHC_07366 [Colletotrichum higginsianum]|nr:hypothetical protein ColKHC_07366 [Colletotrichum higginsianum]